VVSSGTADDVASMKKLAAALLGSALVLAAGAQAVPPTLTSVGQENRHPTAVFSAPRASDAAFFVATKPDQSTDGRFLMENVKTIDVLTDSEIQNGRWLGEAQLAPGKYYVMLESIADFASCFVSATGTMDPTCAAGLSSPATLVVPKPVSRYAVRVRRYSDELSFTLTARPLGERRAYRLCYQLRSKRKACMRGSLDGFDWNSPESDTLDVSTRNLARVTTFTWHVAGRVVLRKTVRR
jgi:hypothetical protein